MKTKMTDKIRLRETLRLALALLGLFGWISVEAESFEALAAMNIQQSPAALNGLWIVYALVPVIGMMISTVFYLFYKLNDKDVQIMAKCNSGEITREEYDAWRYNYPLYATPDEVLKPRSALRIDPETGHGYVRIWTNELDELSRAVRKKQKRQKKDK